MFSIKSGGEPGKENEVQILKCEQSTVPNKTPYRSSERLLPGAQHSGVSPSHLPWAQAPMEALPLELLPIPNQMQALCTSLCPSEEIDSFKREGLSGGGPQPSQGPCRERHSGGQGAIAASPARILRTRRTPLRPGLRSALALGLSYPVALSWPTSCESALSSAGREICRGFTRQDTEITTRQLGLSSGLSHLPWQPASHWVPGRRRWPRGQLVSSFFLPSRVFAPTTPLLPETTR